MTTTTNAAFRLHNDRAHRASCRKLPADAPELLGPEVIQLAACSYCKPDRSPEWRRWAEVDDAEQASTSAELVYWDEAHPRAKHFWDGSGRDGARAYAAALGCDVEVVNRTFTVTFTGARAAEAAELAELAWDAAAGDLPGWRTSREPDGYRGWVLRDRLAADREFMRSWHAEAPAELGAADQAPERVEAAALGAAWAVAIR